MADIGDVIAQMGDKPTNIPPQLLALAEQAAAARDEASEAGAKAKALKEDLEEAMNEVELVRLQLSDRIISMKNRTDVPKSLTVFKEILGDGAATKLWKALKTKAKTKPYLDIPKGKVDEPSE